MKAGASKTFLSILSLNRTSYPLFNPNMRPGMNPKAAATGFHCMECAPNWHAVLCSAYHTCPATFVNVFSLHSSFLSILRLSIYHVCMQVLHLTLSFQQDLNRFLILCFVHGGNVRNFKILFNMFLFLLTY